MKRRNHERGMDRICKRLAARAQRLGFVTASLEPLCFFAERTDQAVNAACKVIRTCRRDSRRFSAPCACRRTVPTANSFRILSPRMRQTRRYASKPMDNCAISARAAPADLCTLQSSDEVLACAVPA